MPPPVGVLAGSPRTVPAAITAAMRSQMGGVMRGKHGGAAGEHRGLTDDHRRRDRPCSA